jgi:hypothetical protein
MSGAARAIAFDDPLVRLIVGQPGYRTAGLVLRAFAALLPRTGLVVSSAPAHSPVDRLLGPGSPRRRHLRFLPLPHADIESYGHPELRRDASAETGTLLANQDVDVRIASIPVPGASVPMAPTRWKLRCLDTLFDPEAPIQDRVEALAVCEDDVRGLEVLQGATATLAHARPMVIGTMSPGSESAGMHALLSGHGYEVFDSFLCPLSRTKGIYDTQPVAPVQDDGPGWFLALPQEQAYERLTAALLPDAEHTAVTPQTWRQQLQATLWREARAGRIYIPEAARLETLRLPVDRELPLSGFHPHEGEPGAGWTWIGPRPRASLWLPSLAGPVERIRLGIVNVASRGIAAGLRATLDGVPTRTTQSPESVGTIEIILESACPPLRHIHRLDLSFPESRRISDDDPRHLVLALDTVTLVAGGH